MDTGVFLRASWFCRISASEAVRAYLAPIPPEEFTRNLMKFHSLWHKVANKERLKRAARQCMARRSSPGVDGVRWRMYRENFEYKLTCLEAALRDETWCPGPTRAVPVKFFTGKDLVLHIPNVETRIVHRALRNAIEPCFEELRFRDWVSGFRKGRSRTTALRQADEYVSRGFDYVADLDVASTSENVETDEVVNWIADVVSDGSVIRLLNRCLNALPLPMALGSGLSPLIINVRLARVDELLDDMPIIRFADNYCFFASNAQEAREGFEIVDRALVERGLAYAPHKSSVRKNVNTEDLFLIGG